MTGPNPDDAFTGALAFVERAAALAKDEKWAAMLTLADQCESQYAFLAEWIRARAYHGGHRFDVAIQCYERALASGGGSTGVADPELRGFLARVWYGLARAYIDSGHVHLAIAPLEHAAATDPSVHDIWRDLGVARITVGQATGDAALIKTAHEPLKTACEMEPANIGSWNALGGLYAMFNIQNGVEQVFNALMRVSVPAAMQFRVDVSAMLAPKE